MSEQSEERKSRSARWRAWLLVPHTVAAASLLAADAVRRMAGTNRTLADHNLGMLGAFATAVALVATIVALFLHPWRRGGLGDWMLLGAHFAALFAALALLHHWIAAHIA